MATRSVVTVKATLGRIALYRHWDGYPAEAGAAILEAIQSSSRRAYATDGPERFVEALLRVRDSAGREVYELTTREEDHGDLDWRYSVKRTPCLGGWWITAERRTWTNDGESETWSTAFAGEQLGFETFVSADRADITARCSARGLPPAYA